MFDLGGFNEQIIPTDFANYPRDRAKYYLCYVFDHLVPDKNSEKASDKSKEQS